MVQPAQAEFAVPVERRRRQPLGRRLARVCLAALILGAGVLVLRYYWTYCGGCSAPIVCAKRCTHIDRAIEQMIQEQRSKLPDRIEQQ
jgi:hypothetical protein